MADKPKKEGESDFDLPEQKTDEQKKEQKEKFVEAAKVDADELDPAKSNPVAGAHLEPIEGAVDLTRFPDEAESVQEQLQERFDRGEDVKQ